MASKDEKTEDPTPRRKSKAKEEGNLPKSQEVPMAVMLVAGAATIRMFAPSGFMALREQTAYWLGNLPTDHLPAMAIAQSMAGAVSLLLLPILAAGVAGAVVANVAQVGLAVRPKAAKPKLSKLSPKQGLKKLKPSKAAWELMRTTVKLGALVGLAIAPMLEWANLVGSSWSLAEGVGAVGSQMWILILRVVGLGVVVAFADYLWNRHTTKRDMKMSKDEVKRENKDTEGNPEIKGKRKEKQREISQNRMLAEVTEADVVVTNPTHYAVALSYSSGEVAPKVIAKGVNEAAKTITKTARRHGRVVTEDPPLARSLYRRCKIGDHVPTALYEAVAAVLAAAYRRYGKAA